MILVVDDEVEMQRLLLQRFRRKIQTGELKFEFARNGMEALQILHATATDTFEMVLTDIRMPEMDGLTLLTNLAELELPLKAVVISAYGDMSNIRTAMNRGAFDFLTKPIDFKDLEITIDKTLTFVKQLREKQHQLQEALDKLHNLVFYDQLTKLPSQNNLLQRISWLIESQLKGNEHSFAILMLDVERYPIIKSGFGHAVGDRLIIEVARRLAQIQDDSSSTIARVGENTFAILLYGQVRADRFSDMCSEKISHLLALLDEPFHLDDITVSSSSRIGLAFSSLSYDQPADFFQASDTAFQLACQKNSKVPVIFDRKMQETAIQRLNLEVELQKAIQLQQLSIHYQPLFQITTNKIIGFEALVRWPHPEHGLISPLTFIPLAEETGLIIPLGEWVLAEACEQIGIWQNQFGENSPDYISVNLSSRQLQSLNLLSHIDMSISGAAIQGHQLRIEITESVLMENIDDAIDKMHQLMDRNIRLLIDDFGTGYSSLSYLQQLPVNALKIDRSFIQDIESNSTNFDITSTIINLAHHLNLEVVAEGLEKQEHLDILADLSCEYGQGFIFSAPLDATAATTLIAQSA